MKLRFIYIILTVFIIAGTAGNTYAEELNDVSNLILNDSDAGMPVLKTLFDSGFFAGNKLIRYNPIMDKQNNILKGKDLILISTQKKIDKNEHAFFNLNLTDPLKQNIIIEWEIPTGDTFRLNKSLKSMTEFALNANKYTVPDALVSTAELSNDIREISAVYKEEDGAVVGGYDLKVHTGFSQTHRFCRTLGELTLLTGFGIANYWINKDANMEDWRYRYTWDDVWPRIRDGWSYDTNAFRTNTLYHIYAGTIYYQIARANEYGILASTVWAFAGSFIWEYIGEWREQTSANDMVFTTIGGALMGEALRQSSIYVTQCMPDNVYGKIVSFILDPMLVINRVIDRAFDGDYRVSIIFVNPAAQAIIDKTRKNF